MSTRVAAACLLTVLLLASIPPSQGQGTQPFVGQERCDPTVVRYVMCIEVLHRDPVLQPVTSNLYRIAYRPVPNNFSGHLIYDALIVGGLDGSSTSDSHSIVVLYDGVTISRILDRTGPQFLDISWAPDGSYALIVTDGKPIYRVDPPNATRPQYAFRNLWDDCAHVQIQGCNDAFFTGKHAHVSFNPVTMAAWISGSSLLQYDGENLSVIESGANIAYSAVSWSPDGGQALLSALVCVDPNNLGNDIVCPQNLTAGQIVPARIILANPATSQLCEVYTYGKYNPQRAEVNDITWAPDGSYALIYGDDAFHGTVLRYDARAPTNGTTSQGCPRLENSFRYLAQEKAEGEFNEMAYNPRLGRLWATAGAGKELWEVTGDGLQMLDILGEHDLTLGKGTIYYGITWDPTLNFALVSGYDGRLYKFLPANAPFTRVLTPKNNTFVTGDVLVAGKSYAPSQFERIGRVEVNVTGPENSSGWQPANITANTRGVANWTYTWSTRGLQEGDFYRIQVRSVLGSVVSNVANRTVRLVGSAGMAAPTFGETQPTSFDGNFTLTWTSESRDGVVYDLEEASLPSQFAGQGGVALTQDFAFAGDERVVYNGSAPRATFTDKDDGQYFYRVRARTSDAVSAWSQPIMVSVALDSDGDGLSDAVERACGSDTHAAGSTCDDLDGDGVANPDDAFPIDATQSRDTDGDGVADGNDKFPLDHRDWSDGDSDGFGDNAERRLGSDPFSKDSTPDADDDGDGCLNQVEADAKTDPRDPASAPDACRKPGSRPSNQPGAATPDAGALAALGVLGLAAFAAGRRGRTRPPR
jgi:thrombospondin type 3 repeat protein